MSKHIQHIDNQNNSCHYPYNSATRANSSDSGEVIEVLRFSFCKTFSQLIDKNDLPATIRRTLEGKETAEEQDKIILAVLNFRIVVKELRENVKHAERERQTRSENASVEGSETIRFNSLIF